MSNTQRIRRLAKERGLSYKEMLTTILDVYELDRIDEYIAQIKRTRKGHLSADKINGLSVLFSYLSAIFRDYH